MKQEKRTEINEIGEFGLIDRLAQQISYQNPALLKGIGDDAAVIALPENKCLLVSSDILYEGLHFDLSYTTLENLGYKAVSVNVSDVLAMNGLPQFITISLSVSNRFSVEAVEALYKGINEACKEYNVEVIGGDTTASLKGLVLSITVLGQTEIKNVSYRSDAKVNDLIVLSGNVGASYLGLQLLEREKQIFLQNPNIQPEFEGKNYIIQRQLKPFARIDIVEALYRHKIKPNAMIDVSDGVSSELFHICKQSQVGCVIFEKKLPIDNETVETALQFNLDPTICALNGGEDYELLFTISESEKEKIEKIADLTIIGKIMPQAFGCQLKASSGDLRPILAQGWNHYKEN